MEIDLIKGTFSANEALELLTQMIHVKIKFLEQKIVASHTEEDIKMRENRIKALQKDLYELRTGLNGNPISVHAKAILK